jgi:peptidoglycan/xylan/chitin deacetylase (PgdA/CDA1 family)
MRSSHQVTLNLHGLGTPPSDIPLEEVNYWLPVGLFIEILERVAHRPTVRLTFDDGNMSDFEVALPEIAKRGFHAEFFVTAGRIGKAGYLGGSEMREMLAAGMGIGLHGMAHRSWADCGAAELDVEVDAARREIEAIAGRSVVRAACPFGAYNARCLRRLRQSGFERVYTSDGGVAKEGEWLQCRNTLQRHHRIEDVEALIEHPPVGLRDLSRRFRTFVKSKHGGGLS